MRRWIVMITACGLIVGASATDPTTTQEYEHLEQQLVEAREQLVEMTAERTALAAAAATAEDTSARYEAALATQEAVRDILHHPEQYGTEDDVIDLLASYATPDAVMDDDVFGAIGMRHAWHNTLYGGSMDAEIDITHEWLSEDGSQGGALWLWHGTNAVGYPFELAGIALDTFDDSGSITHEYVVYPYPDDYVRQAVVGTGNGQDVDDFLRDAMFVFGEDDLCEWMTEDVVTGLARQAYGAVGVDWAGDATLAREHWVDSDIEYECEWRLSGDGPSGSIYVYTEPVSSLIGDLIAFEDLTDPFIPISGIVTDHPDFDDDVLIENHAFGRYGFWTPASDVQLVLSVDLGRGGELDDGHRWEVPLFVVANGFLEAMEWIP